jgi:hypothetical protein
MHNLCSIDALNLQLTLLPKPNVPRRPFRHINGPIFGYAAGAMSQGIACPLRALIIHIASPFWGTQIGDLVFVLGSSLLGR